MLPPPRSCTSCAAACAAACARSGHAAACACEWHCHCTPSCRWCTAARARDAAATALYSCSSRAGARARRSCCGHTLCTGCAAACARREAAAATLLAVAVVALPPVLAEAAAAAAFLALAAQPPVLAAAAYLAPHWPQIIRARCATNSQRTKRLARPNRRARRQQIPDPNREVWGGEKKEKKKWEMKNVLTDFSCS